MPRAIHDGIGFACDEILDETQKVVGTYQPAAGPYAPWAKLSPATQDDRTRRGYPADESELVTGKLRDSYHANVDGLVGGVSSADPVAVVQEFGDPIHNTPARPILGMAFVRREKRAFRALLRPIERLLRS